MISNISRRYARAFFDIAVEEKKIEGYYDEIIQISSVVERDKALRDFLANPVFEQTIKKSVVEKIISKLQFSQMTINFLKLLADKKRFEVLPEIATCYRHMMDEVLKRVRVNVKTVLPLSEEMQTYIKTGLEKMTGRQVEINLEEDPTLLGGIVIGVGDTLYDGSIKNQLNNMRNLLGEAR